MCNWDLLSHKLDIITHASGWDCTSLEVGHLNLDLKNLDLFIRVAALGAIGRAGAEFGLSATNASQRIQILETEIGVKLLHRTTRAVSLTPDGEVFLEHAKRILDDVEEARSVMSRNTKTVQGSLRVTVSASFGRSHVVPFIPEFLKLFPDVQLEINFSDTVFDIVEQGYDLAFRMGELAPSSLLAQKVDENPLVLVASPDYLERCGAPQIPTDLTKHACIPFGRTRAWKMKGRNEEVYDVPVGGRVSVNLGDAIGEWVLAGLGIGQASLWHAGPDIRAGRLIQVLPQYRVWPETKIWSVRPAGRVMPVRVRTFIDFMHDKIRQTNRDRYGDLLESLFD